LRGRGLEILTNTRLERIEESTATLSTGEVVPTRFVCWTAGVKPPAMMRQMGLPLDDHGRIRAEDTTRVPGHANVWAIGDAAAVPDPANKGKPSPPTAQHVIRQGRVVADNVAATLSGGKLRKFRYRTLGVFVDMGQHKAVATMLGIRLRGFPAWFAARTYHVMAMPGNSRRLRIIFDWTVGLLFGRASAQLGNLGHPTSLAEYSEENPRGGERPGEPQEVG
jgi:NADH dehydrogenase